MRALIFLFTTTLLLVSGCMQTSIHPNLMPQTDRFALENMQAAIENAAFYNDSLDMCDQQLIVCDQDNWDVFDSMFHFHDSLFTHHNAQYSHDNAHDDHWHGQNGMMMGHDDDHGQSHSQDEHHSIKDHEQIDLIRTFHQKYH